MEFINDIPVLIRIICILLLLSVNFLFTFFEKWFIQKVYNKSFSIDEALGSSKLLNQSLGVFILFGTTIPVLFLFIPWLRPLENIGRLIIVLLFVIFIMLISLIQQWIMFKLIRQIRDTSDTFKEQANKLIHFLLQVFIPIILFQATLIFLPKDISNHIFSCSILFFLFVTVFLLFIKIESLFFYKKALNAIPLNSSKLFSRLSQFIEKSEIKRAQIFIWPTKSSKIANILMAGLINKKIFISDYLIENMTIEETEALLAHELGHEKKFHLWIRVFFSGLWMPFMMVPSDFFDNSPDHISVLFSMWVILIAIFLYFGFLFLFLTRIQEKQADRYALGLGINPETLISALDKLVKLNNMKFNMGRVDDKFNTHTSISRRIKWIKKISNIPDVRLENNEKKSL